MNDLHQAAPVTQITQARELWFEAPRRVRLRTATVPSLSSGMVRVRALASGVSQGTELLLYRGEGPTPFDPSLELGAGSSYPCRYGYCWVGEVLECAPGVESLAPGMRVFALAPHGDTHVLPEIMFRALDPNIPAPRAVLAANLQTAINCIWDSGLSLGDKVALFGAGTVGLLTAWLATKAGAEVTVIESSERRRNAARAFSNTFAVAPNSANLGNSSDVVIEATGNPATLDAALACAGMEAKVVVVSFYGERSHAIRLGNEFHRRRLALKSSQVSAIPPERVPRWTHARRFELVQRYLRDSKLDELIDHEVPFAQASEVYELLDQQPERFLQTVLIY